MMRTFLFLATIFNVCALTHCRVAGLRSVCNSICIHSGSHVADVNVRINETSREIRPVKNRFYSRIERPIQTHKVPKHAYGTGIYIYPTGIYISTTNPYKHRTAYHYIIYNVVRETGGRIPVPEQHIVFYLTWRRIQKPLTYPRHSTL